MSDEEKLTHVSEEELRELPYWAIVAFAARCARRVQPLLKASWPDAPSHHVGAVDYLIRLAELAARATSSAIILDAAADTYDAAIDVYGGTANVYDDPARTNAVRTAAYAAAAARDAVDAARAGAYVAAYAAARAAGAYVAAYAATTGTRITAYSATRAAAAYAAAARFDLELLRQAALSERWDDGTPVSPDFFGPLWPYGKPNGWPEEMDDQGEQESTDQEVFIELEVPDNVSAKEIRQLVNEIALRANALHMVYGGSGLKVDDLQVWSSASVPEGVPG